MGTTPPTTFIILSTTTNLVLSTVAQRSGETPVLAFAFAFLAVILQ